MPDFALQQTGILQSSMDVGIGNPLFPQESWEPLLKQTPKVNRQQQQINQAYPPKSSGVGQLLLDFPRFHLRKVG